MRPSANAEVFHVRFVIADEIAQRAFVWLIQSDHFIRFIKQKSAWAAWLDQEESQAWEIRRAECDGT